MPGLLVFARRLEQIGQEVELRSVRAVRNAAVAVVRELAENTPVDTGLARSNWLASLNSPRADVVPPRSVEATVAEARTVAAAARGRRSSVVINNNVPYIGRLNAGSSEQAPANFVEAAISAGVREAAQTRLLGRGPRR